MRFTFNLLALELIVRRIEEAKEVE